MPEQPKRPLQRPTDLVPTIFYTQTFKIIGSVHLPHGGRISDFLNKTLAGQTKESFISLTDASCYSIDKNELVHKAAFMTVHKDHIHMAIPLNEVMN